MEALFLLLVSAFVAVAAFRGDEPNMRLDFLEMPLRGILSQKSAHKEMEEAFGLD